MMMNYRKMCLLVCLALLVISCSSGPAKGTRTPPVTKATLTASPAATVSLTPLSMQQAWGQAQFSQFSLDLGDRYFAPEAEHNDVTDDDQMCGSTSPMQHYGRDMSQDTSSVGLMNMHTGSVTLLFTMPAGYGLMGCTVTGPWLIWSQTYHGDPFGSKGPLWQVKALNRQSGEVRLLDQSRISDAEHHYIALTPSPIASNGRVVWDTYSDSTPNDIQAEMYTFATSEKTVLAPSASGTRLSWPWASWGDGHARAIVFKNLESGQQVSLPMQYPLNPSAFVGTSFVYTNNGYSQVVWVPSILAQPMESVVIEDKQTDGSGFDEYPTLNEHLIAWGGPGVWLVFDRKLQRQVKIPIGLHSFDGFVCGHYLVASPPLTEQDYQAQHDGQPYHHVLQVLDINSLP